jgi:hypothetical protein
MFFSNRCNVQREKTFGGSPQASAMIPPEERVTPVWQTRPLVCLGMDQKFMRKVAPI